MLLLRLQDHKLMRSGAFLLALMVNLSLAGLIYGLTIGSKKAVVKPPISINFRQFVDSSVEEQTLAPELTVTPEQEPEMNVLPTPTPQPSFDVANISSTSSIKLPVLSVPEFNVSPSFQSMEVPSVPAPVVAAPVEVTKSTTAVPTIGVAKVLRKVQPQYPYKAQRLKIEGYVLLHILIDDTGRPQEIKVIEEKPRGYFAKTARKAVRRWHFEKAPPGVEVWKKWRLSFELN